MCPAEQQPLELSPAMLIGVGLVVVLGLLGVTGSGRLAPRQTEDLEIVRVAGKPIEFASLGLRAQPMEGWTYLSVGKSGDAEYPVFANVSAHLIVRLKAFPFEHWPPSAEELARLRVRGPNDQDDRDRDALANHPLLGAAVRRTEYAEVSIEWIEEAETHGSGIMLGRLRADAADVLVTAMTHSGQADIEQPLKHLFDSLQAAGNGGG